MAKQTFQPNPRVHQIFDDLEKYLEFTREFGYKYNEADLYDNKSYVFRQYTKYVSNKAVKNMWEVNGKAEVF